MQKISSSLQEVNKVLAPFNLPGTAGSQVIHLARIMERKIEVVDSAHKELEFLHNQNAYMNQ